VSSGDGMVTVYESDVGPVIRIADVSRIKPFMSSIIWSAIGVALVGGGVSMVWFELARKAKGEAGEEPVLYIGAACVLIGWLFASAIVRRFFGTLNQDRIFFYAGPLGVSVGYPASVKFTSLLLAYNYQSFDIAWEEVKTWYPYVMRVNGIPTESNIVFEGEDWKVEVPTMFFKGSRDSITEKIAEAYQRTDLLGDDEDEGSDEADDDYDDNEE